MPTIGMPFYHKLNEPSSVNVYEGKTYPGGEFPKLYIKGSEYKAGHTSFKNVVFKDTVRFEDVHISIGLLFENCTFRKHVLFTNVISSGYSPHLPAPGVIFKDCIFEDSVQFLGGKTHIERAVRFEWCEFQKGLEIVEMTVSVEGITIKGCDVDEKFDLSHIVSAMDIAISDNTINSTVRLENIQASSCSFTSDNIFKEKLFIIGGEFARGIVFNNGTFKKEVQISQVQCRESGLTVIGSEFEKSFVINFHKGEFRPIKPLSQIYLSDTSFKNGLYLNGAEDIFSSVIPCVDEVKLMVSPELKGSITFRNIEIGSTLITGFNSSAHIFLEDVFMNQLKVKAFINDAGLTFTRVKPAINDWFTKDDNPQKRENALYINDSNFGKSQFFQVDFDSFDRVLFYNNIVSDVTTSMVNWFSPQKLESASGNPLLLYKQAKKLSNRAHIERSRKALVSAYNSIREVYRQLKYASQKQGDIPQALKHQNHEMNYYRKMVKYEKPYEFGEHFILWTSLTNNFGQNWIKALCLLIVFSLVCYVPIGFLSSEKLDYSEFAKNREHVWLNIRVLGDNIKQWFIILNPTHRVKDLSEKIDSYSSWIYFWDTLSRVVISYFIFQTVAAFRKFSKS